MVTSTRDADDLELIRELLDDPFSTTAEVEATAGLRRALGRRRRQVQEYHEAVERNIADHLDHLDD